MTGVSDPVRLQRADGSRRRARCCTSRSTQETVLDAVVRRGPPPRQRWRASGSYGANTSTLRHVRRSPGIGNAEHERRRDVNRAEDRQDRRGAQQRVQRRQRAVSRPNATAAAAAAAIHSRAL